MKKNIIVSVLCVLTCSQTIFAGTVVRDTLEMIKGINITPASLLKGKVSGVRVSSTDGSINEQLNVNIRGINSLRGNNEPLYIVDGTVLNNYINEVLPVFWQSGTFGDYGYMSSVSGMDGWNLYDIESIEVLKNTSATALYGSRGANGVIIIKTKSSSSEKYEIDWNSNLGVNTSSRRSEFFQTAFSNNHSLAIGSAKGRTKMRFSAFFRDVNGVVSNTSSTSGGVNAMFDTQANAVVHFGMHLSCSEGVQNSMCGTAWYGAPSAMLAVRGIILPDGRVNNASNWFKSYSDDTKNFRTSDSFYITLNFSPFFRWRTEASVDFSSNTRYLWYDTGTAFGNAVDSAAGINTMSAFLVDIKSALEYEHAFCGHFNLGISAGAEGTMTKWRFDNMNGSKFFYKQIGARGFTFRESTDVPATFRNDGTTLGYFGKISFDYKSLVGVQAIVRTDRDMVYNPSQIVYPAVNAYVDLRGLAFPEFESISALKFEAGWGKSGFGKFIPYNMFGKYTAAPYYEADSQSSAFFDGYNSLETKELDFSLKSGFLNDRVTFSLTYYNRKTADKLNLYQFGTPQLGGVWTKIPREIISTWKSTIGNSGLEVDFGGELINIRDFKWSISGNVAFNTNKVVSLDANDVFAMPVNPSGLAPVRNEEGRPVSSIFGNYLDSENFVIGSGILGETIPKIIGGFQTAASYKNFTLDIQSDWAGKFNILNMNNMLASSQKEVSSAFVESGDYWRLSNVSLRYKVPVLKLDWIKSLSFSLSASNLLILTKYSGWNPDVNCFGSNNMLNGLDYGSNPFIRTVMLGVSAKF